MSELYINQPPISTHALREEGDLRRGDASRRMGISTHALREEGDQPVEKKYRYSLISTHALREEGDHLWPALR